MGENRKTVLTMDPPPKKIPKILEFNSNIYDVLNVVIFLICIHSLNLYIWDIFKIYISNPLTVKELSFQMSD